MERRVSNPRCICGKKMQFKDPVSQSPFRHSPHCGGAEGGMQISVAEQLHNTRIRGSLSAQRQMHRRERKIRDRFSASKKVLGAEGSCPPHPISLSLANFCRRRRRRRISHSNRSFVTSPSRDAKWHRAACATVPAQRAVLRINSSFS